MPPAGSSAPALPRVYPPCVADRQAGVLILFSISGIASPGLLKRWGSAHMAFLATTRTTYTPTGAQ